MGNNKPESLIFVTVFLLLFIEIALGGAQISCNLAKEWKLCPLSKSSKENLGKRAKLASRSVAEPALAQFQTASSSDNSKQYAEINGRGNNIRKPTWGMTDSHLARISVLDAYEDDGTTPAGSDRPSPREISNSIFGRTDDVKTDGDANVLAVLWGQFTAHDIVLSASNDSDITPIKVPKCDSHFDPSCLGNQTLPFTRLFYTNDTITKRRVPLNFITTYIDGSQIYGSDESKSNELRSHFGGRLITSNNDLLPEIAANSGDMKTSPNSGKFVFNAGDVRANENPGLQSLHTIFVREHNRLAGEYAKAHPSWDDEELFQNARKMVIGIMQKITFDEYLPMTIGKMLPPYTGYNSMVDPRLDVFFAAAAFRYGHSGVPSILLRLNADAEDISQGPLILRDVIFNPQPIKMYGVDAVLRGVAAELEQKIDSLLTNELRNFHPSQPFDLAAWNIQRGRDVGIPSYNQVRFQLGLSPADNFYDITSEPALQKALKDTYKTVDLVDAYVGGLSEANVVGGRVGPLFAEAIQDQFRRLRDGDRYYYLNGGRDVLNGGPSQSIYSDEEIGMINKTTLAAVISRNTAISSFPKSAFIAKKCTVGAAGCTEKTGSDLLNSSSSSSSVVQSFAMGSTMLLSWLISDPEIQFNFSSTLADGWYGFGFGTGMVDADMILITKSGSGWTATEYTSDSSRTPKPQAVTHLLKIQDISGQSPTGYKRTVTFSRKMDTGSSTNYKIQTGNVDVIWAWSNSDDFGYHGNSKGQGQFKIGSDPIKTGETVANPFAGSGGSWQLGQKILHGSVMLICFGILTLHERLDWVPIHEHGMTIAAVDIILSALTALSAGVGGLIPTHAKLGVTVFFLTLVNVAFGVIAKKKNNARFYTLSFVVARVHQILGWTTWIIGTSNCFLGLELLSSIVGKQSDIVNIIKWSFVAIMGLVLVLFILFGEIPARMARNAAIAGFNATIPKLAKLLVQLACAENYWNFHGKTVLTIDSSQWVVIDGIIHDVRQYIEENSHPGGTKVILSAVGTDVTCLFYGVDADAK
ncbi:hypothetical protein HK098_005786 [Nowakowskiella sp. JEL0407]|nr:hypothetical protein HK098_005786 [Nowakowskiella sp. JEL0407]